jgi:hypothetical protein
MYRGNAYASPRERKETGRRVGALVRAAGGVHPRPEIAARFRFGRDREEPTRGHENPGKQLSLL